MVATMVVFGSVAAGWVVGDPPSVSPTVVPPVLPPGVTVMLSRDTDGGDWSSAPPWQFSGGQWAARWEGDQGRGARTVGATIHHDGITDHCEVSLQIKLTGQCMAAVRVRAAEDAAAGYSLILDNTGERQGNLIIGDGSAVPRVRPGQTVTIEANGKSTTDRFAGAAEAVQSVHVDQWNDVRFVIEGGSIETYVNGSVMHRLVDRREDVPHGTLLRIGPAGGSPGRLAVKTVVRRVLMP